MTAHDKTRDQGCHSGKGQPGEDCGASTVPDPAEEAAAHHRDGHPVSKGSAAAGGPEDPGFKDRLLRALAEVENTKRRAERDVSEARQYAVSNLALDMIDVADNLERALASIPAGAARADGALKQLVQGVELTRKELLRALGRHGVTRIDPGGESFDPHVHEAMFETPVAGVPAGQISQVISPGYAIGKRILRPAKVGVSSGPTSD